MLQRPGNPYSGKGLRIRKQGNIELRQVKKEKVIKLCQGAKEKI